MEKLICSTRGGRYDTVLHGGSTIVCVSTAEIDCVKCASKLRALLRFDAAAAATKPASMLVVA